MRSWNRVRLGKLTQNGPEGALGMRGWWRASSRLVPKKGIKNTRRKTTPLLWERCSFHRGRSRQLTLDSDVTWGCKTTHGFGNWMATRMANGRFAKPRKKTSKGGLLEKKKSPLLVGRKMGKEGNWGLNNKGQHKRFEGLGVREEESEN